MCSCCRRDEHHGPQLQAKVTRQVACYVQCITYIMIQVETQQGPKHAFYFCKGSNIDLSNKRTTHIGLAMPCLANVTNL